MRAVIFQDGEVDIAERPKPKPGPGEALIRVTMAGICGTDLELLEGYYDFAGVPGHEFVGVVEACPSRRELVGHRVAADINVGCGECPWCHGGDARHCTGGRKAIGIKGRDGAFAQYVAVPAANLRLAPQGLADEAAVFAEPLAAALEVGQQVHLTGGMRLAVLGDGKLGLLCALGLRLQAPGLVLLGRHAAKLEIAAAAGVATRLAPNEAAAQAVCDELGPFDVVVEATGRAGGLAQALDMVRPEGVVVAKTTIAGGAVELDLARLVVDEVALLGSRCGDLALALSHLAMGWVDPAPLVEAVYPFEEFEEALAAARRAGALKVLVRIG